MAGYLEAYGWQLPFALGWGTLAFLVLLVPVLQLQFRRYGRLSARKTIGAAAVAIYGAALASYTLLPLPAEHSSAWCDAHAVRGILSTPFHSLTDIRDATAAMGWRERLLYPATAYTALNVLLFIPWGLLVRRYFGWGIAATVLTGLAGSVLIEATQYTGLWGLYDCAYRYADVDDLLTNTAGTLVGALLAPLLLWWMPHSSQLSADRLQPRRVTAVRRWMGMLIDAVLCAALAAATLLVTRAAGGPGRAADVLEELRGVSAEILAGTPFRALPAAVGGLARVFLTGASARPELEIPLAVLVPWLTVFVLPALWGSGASLGERSVWLAPRWSPAGSQRGALLLRLWRTCPVAGLSAGLLGAAGLAWHQNPAAAANGNPAAVLLGSAAVVVAAAVVAVPLSRGRRGLATGLSGAELVDSRSGLHRSGLHRTGSAGSRSRLGVLRHGFRAGR